MNVFDVFLGRSKQKKHKDVTEKNSFMDFTTKYADDDSSDEEEEPREESQNQDSTYDDGGGRGRDTPGPVRSGGRRVNRERWPYVDGKYEGQGIDLVEPELTRPSSAGFTVDEYVAWVCNGRDDDFPRLRGVLGIDLD